MAAPGSICHTASTVAAATRGVFRTGRSALLSLCLCGVLLVGGHADASQGTDELTREELVLLRRGELVTRPVTEQRGRLELMGGTSWQVIDARPDVVWRALLDTKHYRRMLPRVLEARVVETAGDIRTIYMRQGVGFLQTTYHLKVRVHEAQRDIWFAVDDTKPHKLRAAWGFYAVRPYAAGRTLLTYGVMADLGDGFVRAVVRDTVHTWMMRVPWMIKRFVEGSGRWLYR